MKHAKVIIIGALMTGALVSELALSKGRGVIHEVEQLFTPEVRVTVEGSDSRDYVGFSLDYNGDGEFTTRDLDRQAIRVGKSVEQVSFFLPLGDINTYGKSFVVCLWDEKVKDCGCIYCEKAGYHLEGRLDSWSGVYVNPMTGK